LYIKISPILNTENPLWKELIKTRIQYKDVNFKYWMQSNLFSLAWWIMLITFIVLWVIWWKYLNKTKLFEIITYGFMISFIATVIDELGVALVLWGYPNTLFPIFPPLVFVNLGAIPIILMLIYQHFKTWKLFIVASLITSLLLAFVFEPLTIWLGIYEIYNWRFIYSVPIYFFTPLFFKWLINKIKTKQEHSN
jgi:hypothetical protein